MLQENNPDDARMYILNAYTSRKGEKERCRMLLRLEIEANRSRITPAKLLCEWLQWLDFSVGRAD